MTNPLLKLVANPGLSEDKFKIDKLHHIYRQLARQDHFTVKDDILYTKELFKHDVKFVDFELSHLCFRI